MKIYTSSSGTLAFIILLFFSSNSAFGWNMVRDFNSGPLGAKAENHTDSFDDAAGYSVYSNEHVSEGAYATKLQIKQGDTGFGYWGGIINYPSKVYKGETLWLQFYIYIPSTFKIKTPGNGSLKLIRMASETASGSNHGFIDIQILDDGTNKPSDFRMSREYQAIWYWFGQHGVLTRDKWHRINVQISVSDIPVSDGGTSFIKFWLDGNLLTNETHIKTLVDATDYLHAFYLFTYWNGKSPIDNWLWVDQINLTNQKPAWADALGAKVIKQPPKSPVFSNTTK